MPVYLCQPGADSVEPWRHGIQVYRSPFAMDEMLAMSTAELAPAFNDHHSGLRPHPTGNSNSANASDAVQGIHQQQNSTTNSGDANATTIDPDRAGAERSHAAAMGLLIRRVRHAEIVLVDDVCIAFDRYWLRLRWPGGRGGFAGYIALGKVSDEPSWLKKEAILSTSPYEIQHVDDQGTSSDKDREDDRGTSEDIDNDDPTRDDEPQDNVSTRSSEPFESTSTLTCLRTGLIFPSSAAMKLMALYDDGLSPTVISAPLPSEPVFCRICREGLHDDADDEQPIPARENEGEERNTLNRGQSSGSSHGGSFRNQNDDNEHVDSDAFEDSEPRESAPPVSKGPIIPHPIYHPNQHAAENPMLAPCECSGSMAFVHYLCVEQWRCRSRHPEARQGLQCETCGKAYALPPPTARRASFENEDWLEAMPPHVMAALRQPHVLWQVGAAIVRRRWLRPIAPIVISPIVALYCRGRRLLKKKGVARRRWACSLCRRRARWKCVRCLRSYYCSRQCQNVSWHIVHKHVCYKPTRWFLSLFAYGVLTLFLFPGILRDPMMYDLGLGFVPVSFYVMAALIGGVATAIKKGARIDLRGRSLEILVVITTLWMVVVSWGLVSAFFGDTSKCSGILGTHSISREEESLAQPLSGLHAMVLKPAQRWFLMWDRLAFNSRPIIKKALCIDQEAGCFEHLHMADADFFFEENDGAKCAADLYLMLYLCASAGLVSAGNHMWRLRERQRRAARRPHQD